MEDMQTLQRGWSGRIWKKKNPKQKTVVSGHPRKEKKTVVTPGKMEHIYAERRARPDLEEGKETLHSTCFY